MSSATPLAFDLENVTKSFRAGDETVSVLKNVTLKIPLGQYVAIMGPSGSGKSTLMQLLGCLDFPTSGRVSILGQDIGQMTDDTLSDFRCRAIGFVFQGFHLLPSYDAASNVALSMVYSGKENRFDRAVHLLERFGLGHRIKAKPRTMSGGEQQRVAIARAVANDSPIILADEPTGALDQANGRAILDLFASFKREGKTVVLVTHDMAVAKHAERVIEIVDGKIKSDGKV